MFTKLTEEREKFYSRMSDKAERILRKEITQAFKGHLKNRTVKFTDAMGMTTIDVSRRSGGFIAIHGSMIISWVGVNGKGKDQRYWTPEKHKYPWIEKAQNIINEYDDFSSNDFACEFEMKI